MKNPEKINKLFYIDGMSPTDIASQLGLSYNTVVKGIDRNFLYEYTTTPTVNDIEKVTAIMNIVSDYFRMPEGLITRRSRLSEIVIPRQMAHHLAYTLTQSSYALIGQVIGGLSHDTVMNSKKSIDNLLSYDKDIIAMHEELTKIISAFY